MSRAEKGLSKGFGGLAEETKKKSTENEDQFMFYNQLCRRVLFAERWVFSTNLLPYFIGSFRGTVEGGIERGVIIKCENSCY